MYAPFRTGAAASGLVQAMLVSRLDSYTFKNQMNEQLRKAVIRSQYTVVTSLLDSNGADVNGHADVSVYAGTGVCCLRYVSFRLLLKTFS